MRLSVNVFNAFGAHKIFWPCPFTFYLSFQWSR